MNILFVSPEVFPFARAGGLGDVSYHLPLALADRGHRLWVITPKHRKTEDAGFQLAKNGRPIKVPLSWREKKADIFTSRLRDGIEVVFIACDELFNREGLYGNEFGDYEDNAERFIFFCRAVMETVKLMDLQPDIIHCHDWTSGLIPLYVQTIYRDFPNIRRAATLFTFHNLGSQGLFWHYDFAMTGLGWEHFTPEGVEFHGQLNMTKAGLIAADLISTVSHKYAREVLTPDYGFGLEGVLQSRASSLHAVLNGVDYNVWNPELDQDIAANFSPGRIEAKTECRNDLARIFDLAHDDLTIIGVISRLVDRKGFDLIKDAMPRLLEMPLKMVFMGMGEDKYHVLLKEIAEANPSRIGLKITYDNKLAHKIMAGADIFMMPSRFEPCGLEQLYGLKYGTVPLVRDTGGLDDTVIDLTAHPESGTGFKFHEYTAQALLATVSEAIALYQDKNRWHQVIGRGMSCDFSWTKAAAEYEALYNKSLSVKTQ